MSKKTHKLEYWTKDEMKIFDSYVLHQRNVLIENFYVNIYEGEHLIRKPKGFFKNLSEQVKKPLKKCKSKFQKYEKNIYCRILNLPETHFNLYIFLRKNQLKKIDASSEVFLQNEPLIQLQIRIKKVIDQSLKNIQLTGKSLMPIVLNLKHLENSKNESENLNLSNLCSLSKTITLQKSEEKSVDLKEKNTSNETLTKKCSISFSDDFGESSNHQDQNRMIENTHTFLERKLSVESIDDYFGHRTLIQKRDHSQFHTNGVKSINSDGNISFFDEFFDRDHTI